MNSSFWNGFDLYFVKLCCSTFLEEGTMFHNKAVNIDITIEKVLFKRKISKNVETVNNCCDWASELDPNFQTIQWKRIMILVTETYKHLQREEGPHWTVKDKYRGDYTFNFSGYLRITFPIQTHYETRRHFFSCSCCIYSISQRCRFSITQFGISMDSMKNFRNVRELNFWRPLKHNQSSLYSYLNYWSQ